MATSFLGLRTCIYFVPDVAAATEWYSKVLGFQPYFDTPYYVGFNVGGYELGLHPEREPASAPSFDKSSADEKATAGKGETVETYWGVDDIEATFAHLLACGATAKAHPNNVGDDIWVATVKDPWGNIIGIIKNPHFKV